MADGTNWVDDLLGKRVQNSGTELPDRKLLNFDSGLLAVDDPAGGRTTVTATGAGPGSATWADVLTNGRDAGTNDPRINANRHFDFQGEIDIRRQVIPFLGSAAGELIARDAVLFASDQSGIGQTEAQILTGLAANGVRVRNPTAATVSSNERSPYLSVQGDAWVSDLTVRTSLVYGWQVRPETFASTAIVPGNLVLRMALSLAGETDVMTFGHGVDIGGTVEENFLAVRPKSNDSGSQRPTHGTYRNHRRGSFTTRTDDDSAIVRVLDWGESEPDIFVIRGLTDGIRLKSFDDVLLAEIEQFETEWFKSDGATVSFSIEDDAVTVTRDIAEGLRVGNFARGEDATFEDANDSSLSIENESLATAGVDQWTKFLRWEGAAWDSNAAASEVQRMGWQLRTDQFDPVALPDRQGRLVLRAAQGIDAGRDVMQIRHETDVNDIAHTYLEPVPADSDFIFEIRGRDAISVATAGRTLSAFGGAGLTTGNGGAFFFGGGASPSGDEGIAFAIKQHPIAQVVSTQNETALAVQNITAATAGVQQYSPYFAWQGSAWDTDAVAAAPTIWSAQLRTAAFDGSVLEDFGRLVWRCQSAFSAFEDVIEFAALKLASGQVVAVVRNAGDTQGSVTYRGMDAISASTAGGPGVLQGGVATNAAKGGLAVVSGGPSNTGDQGDVSIDGFNVLIQSFATAFGGMVGGVVWDEATINPSAAPSSSPQQIFIYLDAADGLWKWLDSANITHFV